MTDYLPEDATIEQACNWLQAKTGETWILPRLLECHLTPYFWLDYQPGHPAMFGGRIEGYQTRMMFQGDLCRLKSDGADALVNMFEAHDGGLIKAEPGWRVPLAELRFKREHIERVAEIINRQKTAPAQTTATPAPVGVASDDRPDPERRLELLRSLGGTAKYVRCEWKFTGIAALVEHETAAGRKRSTEKTIRADLKEAAQNERDANRAGFSTGLGQR